MNAGWGVGGTLGANIVWDEEGNIAIQGVKGGGGDVPSISLTLNLELTNAKNVYHLEGVGGQAGIEGGEGLVGEGGAMFGKGYSGGYFGVGAGVGVPVGASGYIIQTRNILVINVNEIMNSVSEVFGYGND